MSDEVVLQRPEDVHFRLPVFHTDSACAGAVTSYLLRRIAYRAGAYAPGIQEFLFHELNTHRHGGTLEAVQQWFTLRSSDLYALGYKLHCRRVNNRAAVIQEWVEEGRGHRGAMLPTSYGKIHPGYPRDEMNHAVGITVDRLVASDPETLVMIDAWPNPPDSTNDRMPLSKNLDAAHRDHNYHALIYYWVGWS
ncbi:MAG: hypothetical protein R3B48_00625 [Kofleriaceae bacterium]